MRSFIQDVSSFSYNKWGTPNLIEQGTFMQYQQKRVFYKFLIVLAFCCPTYMLSLPFPDNVYLYMNGGYIIVAAIIATLYFSKKLTLDSAFSLILLTYQIEICAEIIYCSLEENYTFQNIHIMSNMFLSIMLVMISTCAYMGNTSILLSLIAVASYSVCVSITHGPYLYSYLPLMVIIYSLFSVLGKTLHKNISALQKENKILRKEEAALLKSLQVNREELFAFAQLISKKKSEENTEILLNAIGEQTRRNLYNALSSYMKKERSEIDTLKNVFPELSPSELTICQLILQDKTVGQICDILFKSSGNITSQRANIRAKLKLSKNDNLKEVLQQRMKLYDDKYPSV